MTTEQQLKQLETRVDELLRISARLRQENLAGTIFGLVGFQTTGVTDLRKKS